jgi:hypothetical protein
MRIPDTASFPLAPYLQSTSVEYLENTCYLVASVLSIGFPNNVIDGFVKKEHEPKEVRIS